MSGGDDKTTDFWSRRKAAVRAAEEAEQAEKVAEAVAEERAQLDEKSDEDILEELGLPDPDTLTETDDFSQFLNAAIPERLRRRALRRLWTLNPVFANLDGLVDYAEDYTDAATVVSDLQTVYQVGKGMFDKFAELAKDADEEVTDGAASEDAELLAGEGENVRCEENSATQKDFVEKEKPLFQLTQGDDLVHSEGEDVVTVDLQESASVEAAEDPQSIRRRIRFDYS